MKNVYALKGDSYILACCMRELYLLKNDLIVKIDDNGKEKKLKNEHKR